MDYSIWQEGYHKKFFVVHKTDHYENPVGIAVVLTTIYPRLCGSLSCEKEMEDSLILQKCDRLDDQIFPAVKYGIILKAPLFDFSQNLTAFNLLLNELIFGIRQNYCHDK
uniref:Uncharacterized protein n=1 Tax=Romanomermis culicivorax TaxID=13658 RepID=A0A915HQZ4_ROMCU